MSLLPVQFYFYTAAALYLLYSVNAIRYRTPRTALAGPVLISGLLGRQPAGDANHTSK